MSRCPLLNRAPTTRCCHLTTQAHVRSLRRAADVLVLCLGGRLELMCSKIYIVAHKNNSPSGSGFWRPSILLYPAVCAECVVQMGTKATYFMGSWRIYRIQPQHGRLEPAVLTRSFSIMKTKTKNNNFILQMCMRALIVGFYTSSRIKSLTTRTLGLCF